MNRKAISGSFYVGNKWLVQTHFILDNSIIGDNSGKIYTVEMQQREKLNF